MLRLSRFKSSDFFPDPNPPLLHYDVLADLFGLKSTRHYLITPLLLETRRHGDLINHSLCRLFTLCAPQQQILTKCSLKPENQAIVVGNWINGNGYHLTLKKTPDERKYCLAHTFSGPSITQYIGCTSDLSILPPPILLFMA